MKTILLAITLFVISISCFAQSKDVKAKNILRYPNELRGFKLMKTSKLKVLVPSVSTAEEVRKFYGERKSKHKRTYGCELNKDWYFNLSQVSSPEGELDSIRFYPVLYS